MKLKGARSSSTKDPNKHFANWPTGNDWVSRDDSDSESQYSETATIDDNIGAGRTLDTYFFQPLGNKLEEIMQRKRHDAAPAQSPNNPPHADDEVSEHNHQTASSHSTMSTIDDNIGAGLTVDKYFYQPVGRRIEKLASRIRMSIFTVSPVQILHYLIDRYPYSSDGFGGEPGQLYVILFRLHDAHSGRDVVAGVRSLIKQAQ